MSTLVLLARASVFTLRHTWPVVAFAFLFVPVQFVVDNFMEALVPLLGQQIYLIALAGVPLFLFSSLLTTLYMAGLYLVIWSRLMETEFSYSVYRQALRPVFGRLFLFALILNVVSMSGVLLPFLVFIPYVDIVLLFEKQGFKQAFRRNFALLGLLPVPAIACGIILVALIGWIPHYMMYAELGKGIRYIYSYSMIILTVPLDVCFLVLFSTLSGGKVPQDFPDLTPEDKEL